MGVKNCSGFTGMKRLLPEMCRYIEAQAKSKMF